MSMKRQSLKQNNRKIIIEFLRDRDELSISQIAKAVHLSVPTVKKVLDYYIDFGLIEITGKGDSTLDGGKRPDLYRLNGEYGYVIALHVGPDFIYSAIFDLKINCISSSSEELHGSPSDEEVLERLIAIGNNFRNSQWAHGKKLVNVIIALPGIVNAITGESIYSPHYPQWSSNFPFVEKFTIAFDKNVPVFSDGVNRLQAVAESMKGQAKGKRNFLIVDAMEEGVGAGIIVKGSHLHGFNHLAGEIGHIIIDPRGPDCICGGKGCFEAAVSVKHIKKLLKEGFKEHSGSAIYNDKDPCDVTLSDLFFYARKGDEYSIELLDLIATYFAIGLNNILMVINPDLVIIQGIYVDAGPEFIASIKQKLGKLSLPKVKHNFSLIYTHFGNERGALGAGCFGVEHYFEQMELYY